MNHMQTVKNFEKVSDLASVVNTSPRPMTGDEYVESLRDGREIYLYGDRVKDVTTHPGFRNSVAAYTVSLLRGILKGDPWSAHLLDVAVLTAVFAVCIAISAKIFRWE